MRLVDLQMIQHRDHVVAEFLVAVGVGRRRHVGRRIAARRIGDAAIAPREVAHLRLPGAPVAGELVHEQERRAAARLLVVQAHIVAGGGERHGRSPDFFVEGTRSSGQFMPPETRCARANSISAAFTSSRALLLDPVAGAVEQDLALQVRHHAVHLVERALSHRAGDDRVVRAGDEQRGLHDLRACHGAVSSQLRSMLRYQLSPPRNPVRAYSAANTVDVGLGQPWRHRHRRRAEPEEALRAVHIHAHLVVARRVARADVEDARTAYSAHRARTRPRRPAPGNRDSSSRTCRALRSVSSGGSAAAPAVRHAHRDDRGEDIRPHQRRVPGDRRAPVVADDQRRASRRARPPARPCRRHCAGSCRRRHRPARWFGRSRACRARRRESRPSASAAS